VSASASASASPSPTSTPPTAAQLQAEHPFAIVIIGFVAGGLAGLTILVCTVIQLAKLCLG
jgi:hypothetical protein